MKKILIASVLITISSLTSCRNQPSEVSFSCTRLASCYSAYSSMVQDPQVKSLVQTAQKSGDEASCVSAIQRLSQSINQQCPF